MLKIAVVLEPCEEGGFSAHVPTVPGCFGEGETLEETLVNIRQAIELHLEAVDDDLIVEENFKVVELVWDFTERQTVPPVTSSSERAEPPAIAIPAASALQARSNSGVS